MDERVARYLSREDGFDASIGVEQISSDGRAIFAAWLVDFPGCIAQGQTETEAVERLTALAPAFLESMIELGVAIPEQRPGLLVGFMQFYSGIGAVAGIDDPRRVKNSVPTISGSPALPTFEFSPA